MTNVDIEALKNASMRLRLDQAKKKNAAQNTRLNKAKRKRCQSKTSRHSGNYVMRYDRHVVFCTHRARTVRQCLYSALMDAFEARTGRVKGKNK